MGIPSYFSFVVKNYPNIIQKFSSFPIDNLYLDANSIIYDAIRSIDVAVIDKHDIKPIISLVIDKICSYIRSLQPSNCVMIAFDGVAPVAKLEQQRQRRYKSQYQTQLSRTVHKNPKLDPFNTSAITPGTLFMKELNSSIQSFFIDPSAFHLKSFELSLSDEPGEGEHKIFEHIRSHVDSHRSQTTVVYGLDADLIMLSLNHLHISNKIFLFRETPEFIKSISADLEPNELYYLNIESFALGITEEMCSKKGYIDAHKILDYILICFFLGNDFMPHFPALNIRSGGIHKVLNAYKATIGPDKNLVNSSDFSIHWTLLRKFILFLAKKEEQYILEELDYRNKMEKRFYPITTPEQVMAKFESIPTYQRDLEKKINPAHTGWQSKYYSLLNHTFNVFDICENFLQCLEWTLKYYSIGCVDWRFKYNYHYPPLLADLLKHIPSRHISLVETKAKNPVNSLTQLCYVLPRNCLHLLPKNVEAALSEKHDNWHVNKCEFIWAFCRYFWECHADLPPININELESFLREIK